jgi:hypothetical protein
MPAIAAAQTAQARPSIPAQEFPELRVEVTGAQRVGRGDLAVMLAYHNRTDRELVLTLCAGRCGRDKIFVIDDAGNKYAFQGSSGIGTCCWSFGSYRGELLTVPAHGTARAILNFRRPSSMEARGSLLTLAASHQAGTVNADDRWRTTANFGVNIDRVPLK